MRGEEGGARRRRGGGGLHSKNCCADPLPFFPCSPLPFHADLAAACATAGATPVEVRATVRHLVVVGGYAHCLAATNALAAGGVREMLRRRERHARARARARGRSPGGSVPPRLIFSPFSSPSPLLVPGTAHARRHRGGGRHGAGWRRRRRARRPNHHPDYPPSALLRVRPRLRPGRPDRSGPPARDGLGASGVDSVRGKGRRRDEGGRRVVPPPTTHPFHSHPSHSRLPSHALHLFFSLPFLSPLSLLSASTCTATSTPRPACPWPPSSC